MCKCRIAPERQGVQTLAGMIFFAIILYIVLKMLISISIQFMTIPTSVQDCVSRSKVFDAQFARLGNKFMHKYY